MPERQRRVHLREGISPEDPRVAAFECLRPWVNNPRRKPERVIGWLQGVGLRDFDPQHDDPVDRIVEGIGVADDPALARERLAGALVTIINDEINFQKAPNDRVKDRKELAYKVFMLAAHMHQPELLQAPLSKVLRRNLQGNWGNYSIPGALNLAVEWNRKLEVAS